MVCCLVIRAFKAFPNSENEDLLHHPISTTALVSKHKGLSLVPKYQISLIGALSRWTTMSISNPVTPSAEGTAHSLSSLRQKPALTIQIRGNQMQHETLQSTGRRYHLRSWFAKPPHLNHARHGSPPPPAYKRLPDFPYLKSFYDN